MNMSKRARSWFGLEQKSLFACFPFFGVWTMQVWITWINGRISLSGLRPWWFSAYLIAIAFLVILIFACRKSGPSANVATRVDVGITALGLAGALALVAFPNEQQPSPISIIAVSSAAISWTWGWIRWAVLYARLGIHTATGCVFSALAIGSVVKGVITNAPDAIVIPLGVTLPVLSALMLLFSLSRAPDRKPEKPLYEARDLPRLWKLVMCMAVFEFIYAYSSALPQALFESSLPFASDLGRVVELAVAVFFLWWVFKHHGDMGFAHLWRVVLLLLGLLLVLQGIPSFDFPREALITSVPYVVVAMIWLFVVDISQHSGTNLYFTAALGWLLAYVAPNYFGRFAGKLSALDLLDSQVALILLFALAITLAFCLEPRDPLQKRVFADMNARTNIDDFATLDERCDKLGETYDLTPREIEITKLLCRGRSKTNIAETLFISDNTVRSHARRIYAKLGIHSKQDLYELIGE